MAHIFTVTHGKTGTCTGDYWKPEVYEYITDASDAAHDCIDHYGAYADYEWTVDYEESEPDHVVAAMTAEKIQRTIWLEKLYVK